MTSEGSPHARFRRALLTKNLTLIDAAARELRHLALDDALRMLIVMADRGDARFDRAGARSRLARSARGVSAWRRRATSSRSSRRCRIRPTPSASCCGARCSGWASEL